MDLAGRKKTSMMTTAYLSLHHFFFLFRIHISFSRIIKKKIYIYAKTKKIGRKITNIEALMSSILDRIRKNMEAEEEEKGAAEEEKEKK